MSTLRSLAALMLLLVILAVNAANLWHRIEPQNVSADEGWVINSFHSDIAIAGSSALTITEGIDVDFGSQQKHGIFRTIPTRYRYDDSHDRYYDLEVVSVTDGASPLIYSASLPTSNHLINIATSASLCPVHN